MDRVEVLNFGRIWNKKNIWSAIGWRRPFFSANAGVSHPISGQMQQLEAEKKAKVGDAWPS